MTARPSRSATRRRPWPRTSPTTRRRASAKLTPPAAAGLRRDVHAPRSRAAPRGINDAAGNPLAADKTWTFTVAGQSPAKGPGGPILVVTDPGDQFGRYYAEILRGEGLNAFDVQDGPVTAAMLDGQDDRDPRDAAGQRRRGRGAHQLGRRAAAT